MSELEASPKLAPPESAKQSRASSQHRSSPKRLPKTKQFLPILEESERSVSSADEESIDSRSKGQQVDTHDTSLNNNPIVLDEEINDPPQISPKSGLRSIIDIENLKTRAKKLAARGKEEEAIQFYNRAQRLMKMDLSVIIKKILSNEENQSLGEWLLVAGSIADVRTSIAVLYERLGSYSKAIEACEEAREMYEMAPDQITEGNDFTSDIENGIKQMTEMVVRLNNARNSFEDRKNLHEEAIQIRRQIALTRDPKTKDDLGRKAFVVLYGALDMEKESLGENHPQVADSHQAISNLHKERNELTDAIKHSNKALSILKLCLGPYHPRSAIAFRDLAGLYEKRQSNNGDIDMAIGLYSQATSSFQECYGPKSALVGASLNNEAVMHILQSNFDLAVEKLSDALVAYETSKMNKDKIINTDSAQVWKNLGECHSRRGDYESSHFAYNNALSIQKDARFQAEKIGAGINSGCDDASIADTLLRLGNATKQTMRYEDAHRIYKEALLIYRMHYTSAHRASNGKICERLADAQDRLAHTLYCIAEVQEIRGYYEEADGLYSEALQLRLHSDAQREENRVNSAHVAMALAGSASCHMKRSQIDDAIAGYKESIKYLGKHGVPEDHSLMEKVKNRLEQAEKGIVCQQSLDEKSEDGNVDIDLIPDKTSTLDAKSLQLMEEGKLDEAIKVLLKALAIRRRRLTKRLKDDILPLYLPEKEDVAKTLVIYSTILVRKGEVGQAEMLLREAIRMHQSNGCDDHHPAVSSLLEQLNKFSNLCTI
jgi:tetratricopeptide (TPR) repeat protein